MALGVDALRRRDRGGERFLRPSTRRLSFTGSPPKRSDTFGNRLPADDKFDVDHGPVRQAAG